MWIRNLPGPVPREEFGGERGGLGLVGFACIVIGEFRNSFGCRDRERGGIKSSPAKLAIVQHTDSTSYAEMSISGVGSLLARFGEGAGSLSPSVSISWVLGRGAG